MSGFLYAAKATGSGHVKVGYSRHPARRIKCLASGIKDQVSSLGFWPARHGVASERAAHAVLSDALVRGREWFDVDADAAVCVAIWALNNPLTLQGMGGGVYTRARAIDWAKRQFAISNAEILDALKGRPSKQPLTGPDAR